MSKDSSYLQVFLYRLHDSVGMLGLRFAPSITIAKSDPRGDEPFSCSGNQGERERFSLIYDAVSSCSERAQFALNNLGKL